MKALVLVDVQVDFLPGGALAVEDGDAVVPVANRLMAEGAGPPASRPLFPLVVATQDWHPADHVSFASQHPGRQPFEEVDLEIALEEAEDPAPRFVRQTLWPDHCVQGTRGAELAPGLEVRPVEAIFRKGTDPRIDSYSGFFDNGHWKKTGLGDYLRGRGVEEVVLVGLAADVCVKFTALDARRLGFAAAVVRDGVRGIGDVEAAFAEMAREDVRLVSADELLAAPGAAPASAGSDRDDPARRAGRAG